MPLVSPAQRRKRTHWRLVRPLGAPPVQVALLAGGLALAAAWTASGEAGQRGTVWTSSTQTPTYVDISREAGLTFTNINGISPQKRLMETMGSGGLFFDFDNDGWIDIFLVDGGSEADPAVARTARHRLYRNRRNGTFEDVTSRSGIRHLRYGMGACAGDYDNDGLVDLYITNVGPNVLYRNSGGGVFTDVTQKAGVTSPLWSTSCAFTDFDRDGRLDLFVTNYVQTGKDGDKFCGDTRRMLRSYCHPLVFQSSPNVVYRNAGNGVFTDVTAHAGIASLRGNGLGVAVGDYDDDLWPDVFVANDGVPNFLFHNDGRGGFTDTALIAGVAVHDKAAPDSAFIAMLPLIEAAANDDRNFVKKAVNWALRQVGKRNLALNKAAIACAERLRTRDSRAARWIAARQSARP